VDVRRTKRVCGENTAGAALSKGGSSEEVNNLAARLRHQGVKVVALTFNASSTLAQNADIAVTLRPFVEADPGGLIAMGSTLAHSAWHGDHAAGAGRAPGDPRSQRWAMRRLPIEGRQFRIAVTR
jgi:hypothetical protein